MLAVGARCSVGAPGVGHKVKVPVKRLPKKGLRLVVKQKGLQDSLVAAETLSNQCCGVSMRLIWYHTSLFT